jgi:hypothetical protein
MSEPEAEQRLPPSPFKPLNFIVYNKDCFFDFCPFSDGPLPSVLQEVDLPIIENSLCESMYEKAGYR